MIGDMGEVRKTQRAPKSCYQCYKRKIKCDKRIPCDRCVSRGTADTCRREEVLVHGVLLNSSGASSPLVRLELENKHLQQKVLEYETKLKLERPLNQERVNPMTGVIKKTIDLYSTGIHIMTRDLVRDATCISPGSFEDYDILPQYITKEVSFKLVEFNMKYLLFIHTAVYPPVFYREHDEFWRSPEPQHICFPANRTLDVYLWMSIWYAVLSNSLFMMSNELEDDLKLSSKDAFNLAQITASASLECLHKGKFLTYPNPKSIQAYCLLAGCFHGFAGVHLQNAMLSSIVYIAEALNLHCLDDSAKLSTLDFEFGCRLWWILVIIDWLESFRRRRLIAADDFTTRLPRNLSEDEMNDPSPIESENFETITYNRIMAEIAKIKNRLYFDNKVEVCDSTLLNLQCAEREIELLAANSLKYFDKSPQKKPLRFQRFLLVSKFNFELLVLNRMLLNFKSKESWVKENRDLCLKYAYTILRDFSDKQIPFFFKKYWFASENAVSASAFLLLDILTNSKLVKFDQRLELVQEQFPILRELEETHKTAKVGSQILKPLTDIISGENKKSILESNNMDKVLKDIRNLPKIYENSDTDLQSSDDKCSFHDFLQENEWQDFLSWLSASN